jgi:trimethylamine:corrinoid methyltransferase-like protein
MFLTGTDMDKIFRKILWFFEEKGVVVEHERILKLLDEGGAEVNHKAQHVRFPERMVRELMEKAPSGFTLAAPDPEYDIDLPTNPDYFHVWIISANVRMSASWSRL